MPGLLDLIAARNPEQAWGLLSDLTAGPRNRLRGLLDNPIGFANDALQEGLFGPPEVRATRDKFWNKEPMTEWEKQAYTNQLLNMGMLGVTKGSDQRNAVADLIKQLRREYKKDPHSYYGIRQFHPDEVVHIGGTRPQSFVWDDNVNTMQGMGGTAAFEVAYPPSRADLASALSYSVGGKETGILKSDRLMNHDMPEIGAILMQDPSVVGITKTPKNLGHSLDNVYKELFGIAKD